MLEGKIATLRAENATLKGKEAFYESPNMPTSRPSLYNGARKGFRERRGEDPGGSPGDAAKGRKRDPPANHAGASHSNRPSVTLHYRLATGRCRCGWGLEPMRPVNKLVSDFDSSMRMVTACAVIHRASCGGCGTVACAESPFLEGTSLGPVALGVVLTLFAMDCTDARIAWFFRAVFGFAMAANTVVAARRAIAASLANLILSIREAIRAQYLKMY